MASPSVRQHRAPTVPRQGPAHVRSRLSGGGGSPPVVTYNILTEPGDAVLLETGDNIQHEGAV